jgi:hypothetical protein
MKNIMYIEIFKNTVYILALSKKHPFMDLLILYTQQVGELDILLNLVCIPLNACQP